jgi:hypothetical protein
MTRRPYHPPSTNETAFDCPHCGAYARQRWARALAQEVSGVTAPTSDLKTFMAGSVPVDGYWFAFCERCRAGSVWVGLSMLYPEAAGGPPPNPDLPEDIRADYVEAQSIVGRSPRGAAALLRLCVQKLCKHLGEPGKNINDDIASLVEKGLPKAVQQALDAVRVIGNEAVHPGQMDLRDDRQTAETLFRLVNLVVQRMISDPKEVQEVYDGLPKSKRDQIAKRDQGGA